MRKQTAPRTRNHNQASAGENQGLTANDNTSRQSAGTASVLDNRSHRTYSRFTTPRSRAQHGAGVSAALPCDSLSRPAAVSGHRPRNVNPAG
jgi:hypothetical protein